MLNTPILVLAFNRPEETQQVFDRIRQIQPKQLFVGADGPRSNKKGEQEKSQAVRDIFLNQIDWDCELHTLFRTDNLGCRNAVNGAISWFFEQVEYGIILEDDCVPDLSFFPFCEELLIRYKDNEQVYQISGFNYYGTYPNIQESYFLSKLAFIWGWATWRRAWQKMDLDLLALPAVQQSGAYKQLVTDSYAQDYMLDKWSITHRKENDSWAYAWAFSVFANQGLCIIPSYNLIENAGFNEQATNTTSANEYMSSKSHEIPFPLKHPTEISDKMVDPKRERLLFYAAHKSKWRLRIWKWAPQSLLSKLKKLLNR